MNMLGELIVYFLSGTVLTAIVTYILLTPPDKFKIKDKWYIGVAIIVILIIALILILLAFPRLFYVLRPDGTFHPN